MSVDDIIQFDPLIPKRPPPLSWLHRLERSPPIPFGLALLSDDETRSERLLDDEGRMDDSTYRD